MSGRWEGAARVRGGDVMTAAEIGVISFEDGGSGPEPRNAVRL